MYTMFRLVAGTLIVQVHYVRSPSVRNPLNVWPPLKWVSVSGYV